MELFFFFRPAALSTHYDIIISLYPSVLYFCSSKKLYLLCVVYISGRRREAASPAFTPISSPFCFFFLLFGLLLSFFLLHHHHHLATGVCARNKSRHTHIPVARLWAEMKLYYSTR